MRREWCNGCKVFHQLGDAHLPIYTIWCEALGHGGPEDGCSQGAHSARGAVVAWAERDDVDSAEYSIVSGSPATLNVKCPDGKVMLWIVSGESVPEYTGEPAKKYTCGACGHEWDCTFVRRWCLECEEAFEGEPPLDEEESTSDSVGV